MSEDRAEMNDLASEDPDLVSRMSADYAAWAERSQVVPFGS